MQGAKQCAACGLRFPVRYFQKLRRQPDGRHILCRGCCSTQNMKRYPGGQSGCVSCSVQQLLKSSDVLHVLRAQACTSPLRLCGSGKPAPKATMRRRSRSSAAAVACGCRQITLRCHPDTGPDDRVCAGNDLAFEIVHVGVHVVCRARSATQCVAAIQHHMHVATKHEVECTMHKRSRG